MMSQIDLRTPAVLYYGAFAVCIALSLRPAPVSAQKAITGPSTSEHDPSSIFSNPALVTFQKPRVGIGLRAYHLGLSGSSAFTDLRQGYATYSQPHLFSRVIGLGAGVQYFDSPVFQRIRGSAAVGVRFLRFVSIGVDVSAISISYNEDEFDLVDANDPVFESGLSKLTLGLSAGLFVKPIRQVSVAAGFRDLNNPNTSLTGASVPATSEPFVGATYSYKSLRTTLEVVSDVLGTTGRMYVGASATDGSYARLGMDSRGELASIEGQLRITDRILANYQFHYPLNGLAGATNGSHQLGLVMEFGPIKPPRPTPPRAVSLQPQPLVDEFSFSPTAYVASENDVLELFEKRIIRTADTDVPDHALSNLSTSDIGVLDSTFARTEKEIRQRKPVQVDDDQRLAQPVSNEYQNALQRIASVLTSDIADSLTIVVSQPRIGKGIAVRNELTVGKGAPQQKVSVLVESELDSIAAQRMTREDLRTLTQEWHSPKSTSFSVFPLYFDGSVVTSWSLNITDVNGDQVRRFNGQGPFPDTLEWDWRNESGDVIDAGIYHYRVSWTDESGVSRQSPRKRLTVLKNVQTITVDITKTPRPELEEADDKTLIIRN